MELICSHTSLVKKGFISELKGKKVSKNKAGNLIMLMSLHGTAATWHLQTKLALYKFLV